MQHHVLAGIVLLSENNLGAIYNCPNGCIHIMLGNLTITLRKPQFQAFAELILQSSMKLGGDDFEGALGKTKIN